MEEQEALDLGPEYDSNRGRFVCPPVASATELAQARARLERRASAPEQLSLFPVQAVTAPSGWETYQRMRETLSPTTAPAAGAR